MTNDNLQEHLNNGLYGTPQLHPDEPVSYTHLTLPTSDLV